MYCIRNSYQLVIKITNKTESFGRVCESIRKRLKTDNVQQLSVLQPFMNIDPERLIKLVYCIRNSYQLVIKITNKTESFGRVCESIRKRLKTDNVQQLSVLQPFMNILNKSK